MATVFVVMGNDYPHSVWSDGPAAEAYCKGKMDAQKCDPLYLSPRIYWRVYPFEVDKHVTDPQQAG